MMMLPSRSMPQAAHGVLTDEGRNEFRVRYNRAPFLFGHALHESALFELPRLITLAARLPGAYWSTSVQAVEDGWHTTGKRRTLRETMETLHTSDSLVLLKGLADDAEYGAIFREVLGEIVDRVGPVLRADIAQARATLILSSPHRVTPYHIDGESNFLLQIHGDKIVHVFDPTDRSVLSEQEIESFYCGDLSAARYRSERQGDAATFLFRPGIGVHIPLLAPHWVQNGGNVSIALSINCSLRSNARLTRLYRVNGALRRRGIHPSRPGTSPLADHAKLVAAAAHAWGKRLRGTRRDGAASMNDVERG